MCVPLESFEVPNRIPQRCSLVEPKPRFLLHRVRVPACRHHQPCPRSRNPMRRQWKRRQRQICPRSHDKCSSTPLGRTVAPRLKDPSAERVAEVKHSTHNKAEDALVDVVTWRWGTNRGIIIRAATTGGRGKEFACQGVGNVFL